MKTLRTARSHRRVRRLPHSTCGATNKLFLSENLLSKLPLDQQACSLPALYQLLLLSALTALTSRSTHAPVHSPPRVQAWWLCAPGIQAVCARHSLIPSFLPSPSALTPPPSPRPPPPKTPPLPPVCTHLPRFRPWLCAPGSVCCLLSFHSYPPAPCTPLPFRNHLPHCTHLPGFRRWLCAPGSVCSPASFTSPTALTSPGSGAGCVRQAVSSWWCRLEAA